MGNCESLFDFAGSYYFFFSELFSLSGFKSSRFPATLKTLTSSFTKNAAYISWKRRDTSHSATVTLLLLIFPLFFGSCWELGIQRIRLLFADFFRI